MNNTLQTYPSPLATYDEVVADKDLFMSTLMKLHSEMGTKFWIPKVRFEDMDLHKVFVEVTSHGGIEQIVREQKWNDVFDRFKFPKSQRNPIFIKHVRRLYYSLLHNYEIIYFFKARGLFPPLIGFVYGKNESGYYLVTFSMGSWKLEGVLYESIEKSVVTQDDPQRQSYDVFPNTLTDKANPQELFKTKSNQWDKANKQQEEEKWPPKQNTEADALMEESEGKEGYSNGFSEEDEDFSSGCSENYEDYSNGFSERDEESSNSCSEEDDVYSEKYEDYSYGCSEEDAVCSEKYENYSYGCSEEDAVCSEKYENYSYGCSEEDEVCSKKDEDCSKKDEDYSNGFSENYEDYSNGISEGDEDYSNGISERDEDYSNGFSEKDEDYSNGFSERDEDYSNGFSDSEVEQLSFWAETTTHTKKASDLMNTSVVAVPVTGVLDGIFESGYFVTVTIGSEKLRGVLYAIQSSPVNTITQEKIYEDEKPVNNGRDELRRKSHLAEKWKINQALLR